MSVNPCKLGALKPFRRPAAPRREARGFTLIARKGLKPVKDISRAINRISESNLSQRIVMTNIPEELKELAAAFNHTFDSLEKSFNRQKQFVSDVSHELRTPLAVILSQSEITLRKERPAAEYKKALAGIFDVSQLMSRMWFPETGPRFWKFL